MVIEWLVVCGAGSSDSTPPVGRGALGRFGEDRLREGGKHQQDERNQFQLERHDASARMTPA